MTPTVLSIAGSDPTGGAGIQADIRTMTDIGVYGAAAVTCITVQNSHGVSRIVPLDPGLVQEQIRAVLDDHFVTQIKIGMIGTTAIGHGVAEVVAEFPGEVILDPVLAASTGEPLTDRGGPGALPAVLLDRATVLTPNLPELALLTGHRGAGDPVPMARELLAGLPRLRAVLVKGGHGAGETIEDLLLLRNGSIERESHPRIATVNSHGTGCILSSAYAAFLGRGLDLTAAFVASVRHLQGLFAENRNRRIVRNASGHGPLFQGTGTRGQVTGGSPACAL